MYVVFRKDTELKWNNDSGDMWDEPITIMVNTAKSWSDALKIIHKDKRQHPGCKYKIIKEKELAQTN